MGLLRVTYQATANHLGMLFWLDATHLTRPPSSHPYCSVVPTSHLLGVQFSAILPPCHCGDEPYAWMLFPLPLSLPAGSKYPTATTLSGESLL